MSNLGRLWEVVELLQVGASTNLFGLGCPSYCGSPSLTSLLLTFFLGLLSGWICALAILLLALYHFGLVRLPYRPAPGPPAQCFVPARLQGYLHGL